MYFLIQEETFQPNTELDFLHKYPSDKCEYFEIIKKLLFVVIQTALIIFVFS